MWHAGSRTRPLRMRNAALLESAPVSWRPFHGKDQFLGLNHSQSWLRRGNLPFCHVQSDQVRTRSFARVLVSDCSRNCLIRPDTLDTTTNCPCCYGQGLNPAGRGKKPLSRGRRRDSATCRKKPGRRDPAGAQGHGFNRCPFVSQLVLSMTFPLSCFPRVAMNPRLRPKPSSRPLQALDS